jgi:hypothetical protein
MDEGTATGAAADTQGRPRSAIKDASFILERVRVVRAFRPDGVAQKSPRAPFPDFTN